MASIMLPNELFSRLSVIFVFRAKALPPCSAHVATAAMTEIVMYASLDSHSVIFVFRAKALPPGSAHVATAAMTEMVMYASLDSHMAGKIVSFEAKTNYRLLAMSPDR